MSSLSQSRASRRKRATQAKLLSTALPRWRLPVVVTIAGAIATGVEFFKLYHSPGMDAFRLTLPGMILLGRTFSVRDIVAYWVAICFAAWVDERIRLTE